MYLDYHAEITKRVRHGLGENVEHDVAGSGNGLGSGWSGKHSPFWHRAWLGWRLICVNKCTPNMVLRMFIIIVERKYECDMWKAGTVGCEGAKGAGGQVALKGFIGNYCVIPSTLYHNVILLYRVALDRRRRLVRFSSARNTRHRRRRPRNIMVDNMLNDEWRPGWAPLERATYPPTTRVCCCLICFDYPSNNRISK